MQKTVVIIPCYNESQRIDKDTFGVFLKNNPSVSLLFVDDGSLDNTYKVLSQFEKQYNNAHVLKLEKNGGKAEAIRQAFLKLKNNSDIDYVGYFDADLSTSLDYVITFKNILSKSNHCSAVIGSRVKRLGSRISRSMVRHFFGRIVATIASNLLSLPVYDTQCGAKLFKRSFIHSVFDDYFYTKWLFDIEIFFRLNDEFGRSAVIESMIEYPLEKWIDEGDSRIKLKDFFRVPLDLLKIALKY